MLKSNAIFGAAERAKPALSPRHSLGSGLLPSTLQRSHAGSRYLASFRGGAIIAAGPAGPKAPPPILLPCVTAQEKERLHGEVQDERRMLQTHLAAKTDALRLEADERVAIVARQMEERLSEAKNIHAAQLAAMTAHYDSIVRNPRGGAGLGLLGPELHATGTPGATASPAGTGRMKPGVVPRGKSYAPT